MKRLDKPFILDIATAVPEESLTPKQYCSFISQLLGLNDETASFVARLGARAKINKRHTVIRDFGKKPDEWTFFNPHSFSSFPTTAARNDLYKKEAPHLSLRSSKALLERWKRPKEEITHVIFVSCTGLMAPGIELLLIDQLGLSPSTQRIALNFMGCFGAFRALAVASAIAEQSSHYRILIVCTELCSLHVQSGVQLDTLVGNTLFSDGSAALMVGALPRKTEQPLWEIVKCGSEIVKNSSDSMTWDVSDQGFVMRLSSKIPDYLKQFIASFAHSLLDENQIPFSDVDWPIHPGGKAIVKAIELACHLNRDQTVSTWKVLEEYGNMSSAAFPFVLDHLRNETRKPWAIGLGFGPGLSVEGILLRRHNDE